MNILFVGDMVGKGGRRAVRELVPALRREFACTFCIANGENMAGGGGMTRRCIAGLQDAQVDVFTGGDHMWDQGEFEQDILLFPNVLRPANVCSAQPGRGWGVFQSAAGVPVGVLCLLGRTFMHANADCPFQAADRLIEEIRARTPVVIVDFHAEATSEKIAMGRYLDGRVSAVLGTHTHVPTADARVFPGGTAFLCDVGMVGSRESILGRAIPPVLRRFSTGMPARFKVVEDNIRLDGAVVSIDPVAGRAHGIHPVHRDLAGPN